MSEQEYVIELTTEIDPAPKFTVDGEEYNIRGFEHLSPEQEAEVTASLARYESIQTKLALTSDDREAKSLAVKLRNRRIQILTQLTSLPEDVASTLPLKEQVKLMKAVQQETSADDDEGDSTF